MLILTHQLNKKGGLQITTGSGEVIWISFMDLQNQNQNPTSFKIALEAPESCKVLQANLVNEQEIKTCSVPMQKLLMQDKKPPQKQQKHAS